ncbi:uncharacterized protein FOMMEDRAFT_77423 [Fomitiporia mediterranea MF3/22]|uniref:uncharacterized protein n=1 Tax=Fomitiporia mediterranea (strain MF3/22) TaxID=694068 RepID=UPI0004409985|nr:uncharacterized protein FOMMEDRAFT_77423 [Fomitiporia mediterranea MF3/22]EJD06299.1 hypothetical protein FOMMEDRAFT_77423 [Fomitiporia mediterranea MF3/22]
MISWRRTLVPYLTTASHVPAPLVSAFLLVHLSAPIVANIGGASLSSSLLGREYYQGAPRELLFVFGPLGLHVSASILKRLLSPYPPRPLRSLLSVAGYTAATLLPIHVLIHRIYSTDPSPPISSIGPAQLDFSFVQHALSKFPIRSLLMYGALAGASILHALEGFSLLYDTYVANPEEPKRWDKSRVQRRRIAGAMGILAVAGGLYALWSEPIGMPLPSLLARFDAVLSKSFVYRI